MRGRDFIKDKISYFIAFLIEIGFLNFFLNILKVDRFAIIFLTLFLCILFLCVFFYDYQKRCRFYKWTFEQLKQLEKAYFISELLEEPNFLEGKYLYQILQIITKTMNDELASYRASNHAYREYIEMWVHEIKTPIASGKLILTNHPGNLSDSLEEEFRKIEDYVEQTLYYARSNSVEKDYIIQEIVLSSVVKEVIGHLAKQFIQQKVHLNIDLPEISVYSDRKWLIFILSQLIGNSLKYMDKAEKKLEITIQETDTQVYLILKDNGIGICEKDMPRIFEKGFTGENGRIYGKSTGIGLYLCRKLCEKLGLKLEIKSIEKRGTSVYLYFPKDTFYQ